MVLIKRYNKHKNLTLVSLKHCNEMFGTAKFTDKLFTTDGINYLNIGLMVISLIAAYIIPFELFLFSYAVFGPLHYLTEISWLDKKKYFVKSKQDMLLMFALVILLLAGRFQHATMIHRFRTSLEFTGFSYAFLLLFVDKQRTRLILIAAIFALSVVFHFNSKHGLPFLLFAILLPSIVHVFLFTGSFILFGALKSRSLSGMVSLGVFILCAITFFLYMPNNVSLPISNYGKQAYSLFGSLNTALYKIFGFGNLTRGDIGFYTNPKSIAIMRFLAFAYTYHYLNWFSKTSVIKWNEVSKLRMTVILVLWVAAVTLYGISYRIGIYALSLLSTMHVFFEYPLNNYTIMGIGKELRSILINQK